MEARTDPASPRTHTDGPGDVMSVLATTGDGRAAPVDAPVPLPGPHEVLLRVDAATINFVDRFMASGGAHRLGLITHENRSGSDGTPSGASRPSAPTCAGRPSAIAWPACARPTTASTGRSPTTSRSPRAT